MATIRRIERKRGVVYKITVCLGRDGNGNKIEHSTTYTPEPLTKTGKARSEKSITKEVEEFAKQFEKECKESPNKIKNLTIKELADKWLKEYCEMQLSPTSIASYRAHLEQRILPRFGTTKINEIAPYTIQKFVNDTFSKGERLDGLTGKSLSPGTIKKMYVTMSSMFSWAVSQGLLNDNPCRNVKSVRQTRQKRDIESWDAAEAYIFLKAMQEQGTSIQFQTFFHIALFCGMRRGEIVALRWSDIDFVKMKIHVRRSVVVCNGEIIEKKPKTSSSIRSVAFDSVCNALLQQWQREQFIYHNTIGSAWEGEDFVFIQDNGIRMHPDTPHGKFKKIIRRYNQNRSEDEQELPEIPLHGLRHTYATLAIAGGVDVRTVSSQLGHVKTSTTTDIYAQVLEETSSKATSVVSNMILGRQQDDKENKQIVRNAKICNL